MFEVNSNLKVSGAYSYKVLKADGSPTGKEGHVKNMLLDNYVDAFSANGFVATNTIHVGTGTAETVGTMTALQNKLLSSSGVGVAWSGSPTIAPDNSTFSWTRTVDFAFTVGTVVGAISELGCSFTGSATVIHSRTLIKDGGGNLAPINVAADEQLVVTHYLTATMVTSQAIYTVSIDIEGVPTDHTITALPCSSTFAYTTAMTSTSSVATVYSADSVFGAANTVPSGGTSVNLNAPAANGTGGNYPVKITVPPTQGNFGTGIGYVRLRLFKYKIEPPIMKTADMEFEFTTNVVVSRA